MIQPMSNRPGPRTPTSIAMNERERVLAEAIGRLTLDSPSAGAGVRQALRVMEDQLRRNGLGDDLKRLMGEIRAERRAEREA